MFEMFMLFEKFLSNNIFSLYLCLLFLSWPGKSQLLSLLCPTLVQPSKLSVQCKTQTHAVEMQTVLNAMVNGP